MPIAPPGPGEVVTPKETSVVTMIDRFKSRMAEDKSAPAKPPEKPAAIAPVTPPPAPAPAPEKPVDKSVVPKLEPLPEKKAEVPTEKPVAAEPPKTEIPEKLSHKNFKEVLTARDDFKTKYEAAEKRAKEFEAKLQEQSTRTPPELEETKKQLAEKDHFINQFLLEQSEEFKNAFDRPIEQAILDAKDVVGGEKGERLADILKAPDGKWRTDQIKALVGELEDEYEKGVVRDAVTSLRKLERSRKDELQKAGVNVQALKQKHLKQQEEYVAQQRESKERLANFALDIAVKSLPEFRESEDPSHNIAVAENKALLKKFIGSDLPPDETATMAIWAVHGIRSKATEKALNEKVAALEAEIQKLSAASPDLDGEGGRSEASGGKADTPEKMGARFMEASQRGIPGR